MPGLERQLAPFTEKGALPSFSISIGSVDSISAENLKRIGEAGEYGYYSSEDKSWYISLYGTYIRVDRDLSRAEVFLSEKARKDGLYETSYLLMRAYMYRLADTGNFMIHSAAVVFENSGILFCGESGAGKSTQAELWIKYLNARVLNYDKPCIINGSDGIWVHGSPWSGKEGVYINDRAPAKAIVFVKQAETCGIERLSAAKAFLMVYMHNYLYPLSEETEKKYFDAVNSALRNIPVYILSCDISEKAVETLYGELFRDMDYHEKRKVIGLKYRIKEEFAIIKIAGEDIVIMRGPKSVDFNSSFVFNESGAYLWDYLKKDFCSEERLSELLAEKFSIDSETAQADVRDFISEMKENGLLDEI